MAVSQYSRSVLWLGKGLLGESRYKICIVTEAASWLGAGPGVQGAQQVQAWALGRAGQVAAGARGVYGVRGRALQVARLGAQQARGRAEQAGALGTRGYWASGRRRCGIAGGALGVSARGVRHGRAGRTA